MRARWRALGKRGQTSPAGLPTKDSLRRGGGLDKSLKTGYLVSLAAAAASALPASLLAYLRRKRSTRPAVSSSFCLPVKNGWQAEQISTLMSPLWVERVMN